MKVTPEMIEAFAEKISFADHELDDELVTAPLQAVLDLLEPFISAAAKHVCSGEVDEWNDACDAWDKLPAAIQHALVDEA